MTRYRTYIITAVIILVIAFGFNATFSNPVKEGANGGRGGGGHMHGGRGAGGNAGVRDGNMHGGRTGYSGNRGWIYGKGYYNNGEQVVYNRDYTFEDGWLWWWYPMWLRLYTYVFPYSGEKVIVVYPGYDYYHM